MKTIIKNYDSVGEYVADLTDGRPSAPGCGNGSQENGRERFFQTKTFGEALSLVSAGWADGVKKVASHRDGMSCWLDAAKAVKAGAFGWDVTGDFIDVGRVLSGEPECCGVTVNDGETVQSRAVSIRLNACVSAAVSTDTIIARGVAVLVAVDLLESLGTRCEVIVSQSTKTGSLHLDANVVVKRASDPVDPDRLAFAVAHPSFFRRLGFRFMELYGHNPGLCMVSPMSDVGTRQGVVEIDELLSGVALSPESLKRHVIAIATKCGLSFTDEQIAEIAAAS